MWKEWHFEAEEKRKNKLPPIQNRREKMEGKKSGGSNLKFKKPKRFKRRAMMC